MEHGTSHGKLPTQLAPVSFSLPYLVHDKPFIEDLKIIHWCLTVYISSFLCSRLLCSFICLLSWSAISETFFNKMNDCLLLARLFICFLFVEGSNLNSQNGLLKEVLHERDEKEKKKRKKHEKKKKIQAKMKERGD